MLKMVPLVYASFAKEFYPSHPVIYIYGNDRVFHSSHVFNLGIAQAAC